MIHQRAKYVSKACLLLFSSVCYLFTIGIRIWVQIRKVMFLSGQKTILKGFMCLFNPVPDSVRRPRMIAIQNPLSIDAVRYQWPLYSYPKFTDIGHSKERRSYSLGV